MIGASPHSLLHVSNSSATVRECGQCAARCSGSDTCKSYECSKRELLCRMNGQAEPSTASAYRDFVFCSKEVAVLPELSSLPRSQSSARRLLQRHDGCEPCSRCEEGTKMRVSQRVADLVDKFDPSRREKENAENARSNALLLKISELAHAESRQLREMQSSKCNDEPNWIDPVSGSATCSDWKGFDCIANFGAHFSRPAVVIEKCRRTCGMCPPADEVTGQETVSAASTSDGSDTPEVTHIHVRRPGTIPPTQASADIRYVDVKSGQAFYGPANGQRVFKNPWETRYDDPFGFGKREREKERKAREEWNKFDSFLQLQRQGGVEKANAEAEDMVRLRRQGLLAGWMQRLPPLVYRENHWFKRR